MKLRALPAILLGAFCLGPAAAVVFVDANAPGPTHDGGSWPTAYRAIQAGIDAADPLGEHVWVAEGIYYESVALKPGVEVYGGFTGTETSLDEREPSRHPTVIDACGAGRVVVGANSSRLDGFTVRNGRASTGAGVYCYQTSPVIANCTIRDNTAVSFGGGLYISGYSTARVIDCRIVANAARDGGGAAVYVHSAPVFDRCVVSGNTGQWGAGLLFSDNTNPTVRDCEITRNFGGTACFGAGIHLLHNSGLISGNLIAWNSTLNQGGGIYGYDTTARIEGNLILENLAEVSGGGISVRFSSPVVVNNVIALNRSGSGGGIESADSSAVQLAHNTLVANRAFNLGGGVYARRGGAAALANCVISDNEAAAGSAVYAEAGCSCTVSYCCIHSNLLAGLSQPEDHCVYAGPEFAAGDVGDYHIGPSSPCVDSGVSASGTEVDMDGNPRCIDGDADGIAAPDIGCYEHASDTLRIWFVGQAKAFPDSTAIRLSRKSVTAVFDGFFYVGERSGSAGLRVCGCAKEGERRDVAGTLQTADGERVMVERQSSGTQ